MRDVYVIGVHTTPFGKHPDKSYPELVKWTVDAVVEDAGISKSDIESVHFGNCTWGYSENQHGIRGQLVMREAGIDQVPITNVEGACATGSIAVNGAWKDILTGLYECTLAVGAEKLYMQDKAKMMDAFRVVGLDTAHEKEHFDRMDEVNSDITIEVPGGDAPHSRFMDVYRYSALNHMQRYGTTQRQLAIVAAKSHTNACKNPNAQYKFAMTPDDVLNDYVACWPFTRSMCSPIGDGAASAVLCSGEFLAKLPESVQKRAVKLLYSAQVGFVKDDPTLTHVERRERSSGSVRAAQIAYEKTGLTPEDMDVAEVHDASAIAEILQYENLGFCPRGEGGRFAESGATQIGGKIPVNPSGGLISRGHPIGASGLAMMHEIVTQLRGEAGERQVVGAKTGIIENGGGSVDLGEAAAVVNILQKA